MIEQYYLIIYKSKQLGYDLSKQFTSKKILHSYFSALIKSKQIVQMIFKKSEDGVNYNNLLYADLMVPLGDGNGLLNPPSESGMFIRRGTIGFCFTGEGILTATGGSASPTKDWKDSLMFVLGNRKVQLQQWKMMMNIKC